MRRACFRLRQAGFGGQVALPAQRGFRTIARRFITIKIRPNDRPGHTRHVVRAATGISGRGRKGHILSAFTMATREKSHV
jgi:hypothetical protein